MADKKLNIKVRADGAKRAKKDIKNVESGISKLGKAAAVAGAAFFAAKGLVTGFKRLIELSAAQELAEKKLEAALGKTSNALLKQASALQQVSMFGDEQIIEAQALIAAFVDEEEAIAKATKATIDLAAAKGMDLTAAADLVSKTLGSSTNAMSRYGIEVNGAVGSQERLNSLVDNVADKFGGQAKAQTETLAGAMRQLDMAVGDLGEQFGDVFNPALATASTALANFAKKAGETNWDSTFSSIKIQLSALMPMFGAMTAGLDRATALQNQAKQMQGPQQEELLFTTEQLIELGIIGKDLEAQTLQIRKQSLVQLDLQEVTYKEINSSSKKAAEFASQTASSLLTSAVMGDDIADGLKRAVIQLGIMVAQAKVYQAIMSAGSIFGGGGIIGSAVNFLFGASPTQSAGSASGASNSKITINQSFGGMGVIDHNYAANSIIPAINKAISTGQARIN
tara:strand:+ start:431 stop:1792 length:1362 start_codon:yes stop_codon:yes gene_type:complete